MYQNIAINDQNSTVDEKIWNQIKTGKDILLITGFSSLEFLISKVHTIDFQGGAKLRFLVGNEFSTNKLLGNIEDKTLEYWQQDSFQHNNIQKYKRFYDYIIEGKIEVRIDRNQHSKVYSNETYATAGSANFSYSGFKFQKETMVSDLKSDETYRELREASEQYWDDGEEYTFEFAELLERIMYVEDNDWRKAFYYVFEEFFMGKWYEQEGVDTRLWETQRQFLSQAIILLEKYGGFINADPTGAGKTIETIAAIKYLHDKYNKLGELTNDTIKIVCPKAVKEDWERDLKTAGIITYEVISNADRNLSQKIKNAKVLAFDEAHSHSSEKSQRAKASIENNADYKIFITATPITKKIKDYYGLLLLFGVDNLDDVTFESLNTFFMSEDSHKHADDIVTSVKEIVAQALSAFTIRRTKTRLSEIAETHGQPTYPRKINKTFNPIVSKTDESTIYRIRRVSSKLEGLYYTKKYTKVSKKTSGQAEHRIIYSLRSSKIALIELIYGTEYAFNYYNLNDSLIGKSLGKNTQTGCIHKLTQRRNNATNEYARKLYENEISLYQEIGELAKSISEDYTNSKLNWFLNDIQSQEDRMYLMFDRSPITTYYYYAYVTEKIPANVNAYFANGATPKNKDKIQGVFSPRSKQKGIHIAFTTDVFSEGVNLQKADCFISSDIPYMPSRQEQRIGRVDRMNSEYETVDIVWIEFPECLVTKNDTTFKKRFNTVNQLLGSNYKLPDFFDKYLTGNEESGHCFFEEKNTYENIDKEYDNDDPDEEFTEVDENEIVKFIDSFGNYQLLESYAVDPGKNSLLSDKGRIYSFVKSSTNWSLIYYKEKTTGYPSLAFVDLDKHYVLHDFQEIVNELLRRFNGVTGVYKKDIDDNTLNELIDNILLMSNTKDLQKPTGEQNAALSLLESHMIENYEFEHDETYDLYKTIENKKGIAKLWHSSIKQTYINYLKERVNRNSLPTIKGIKDELDTGGYLEAEYIYDLLESCDKKVDDYAVRVCIIAFND